MEKHLDEPVLLIKDKILELDSLAVFVKVVNIEGGFLCALVKKYKGLLQIKEIGPYTMVVPFSSIRPSKKYGRIMLPLKNTQGPLEYGPYSNKNTLNRQNTHKYCRYII